MFQVVAKVRALVGEVRIEIGEIPGVVTEDLGG
jgi:hypothetical protein